MKTIAAFALVLASFAAAGCSGAPRDDASSTSESSAALTSAPRLERSHIEVSAKNQTSNGEGICNVDSAHFRITYTNDTLPAGTKITLHWGHSAFQQEFIGDGFGWSDATYQSWQDPKDVDMQSDGSGFSAELDANAYGRTVRDWSQGWEQWRTIGSPPEIQFVFRVEMPDGTVAWDNRLNRDYGAAAAGAACPSLGDYVPLASWGPF